MPSLQTQYKLADLLKAISEGEKQVEIVRQVLAEKPDFEPYAAFKRIDRNSNSFITTYDLLDFLREHDVAVLEKDIRNLFKEHNTHSNDRVSYTEFLDILLPKASSVLRQLCTQRESYPVAQDQVLPYEVEWALARVFEKELDLISSTEILKQDLADRYDFDPSELYRCIDTGKVGVIDFDLLYFFFKANRVPITDAEILALLRRTDKDVDGKLTFSEFRSAVLSVNSPSAGASGRSPVRKATSRVASPQKKTPSRTANSSFLSNSVVSNKRSNAEYIDYVYTSAKKSAGSRSPSLGKSASPVRKTSTFDQSVKAMSPVRDSVTKRLQEANKQEMDRSLRESMRSSLYRTPTKREASPVRSPVFSPARSPVRSPARSPVRESEYASSPSRSPSRRQLSPMKGNEEEHLANALKEQIELDKELETTKVDLALRRDFNLLDAFKFFDLAEKGSVCKSEIRDALNELGVFPTNDELYLVMRKFDKNNDGLIRFSDFRDMLTPKEGGYTELLNKREPTYADGAALTDIFSEQTLFLLKKTLNMIIKNEVYSESIRQRLNRRPLFDTWEGFKALDKDNNGYVRAYEFKDMLIEHGFYPSSKEVMNLVDRYDRNQDGKVSYSEFVNEISPKSPKKY